MRQPKPPFNSQKLLLFITCSGLCRKFLSSLWGIFIGCGLIIALAFLQFLLYFVEYGPCYTIKSILLKTCNKSIIYVV